jgi:amino acid adenylation domain-containing protein/thioester reductase-like protein
MTTALPKQSEYDVTTNQRGLWLFQQMKPHNVSLNKHYLVHLDGYLDTLTFSFALRDVVERHDILRTIIVERNEKLQQTVLDEITFALPIVDLTECPTVDVQQVVNAEIEKDLGQPFELNQEPLFRFKLFQVSEYEHLLSVVVHSIVSDRITLDLMFTELGRIYSAHTEGRLDDLLEIPPKYREFVSWHQELSATEAYREMGAYWLNRLAAPLPVLELPTEVARPLDQSYGASMVNLGLSSELSKQIVSLCWQREIPVSAFMMTAYFAWLQRMTGEDDMIIGTPFDGRFRDEFKAMLGPLSNTLPIRISYSETDSFEQLLQQVLERVSEATEHLAYPFERLLEEVDPVRDPSRTPIYSTLFQCQEIPQLNFAGLHAMVLYCHEMSSPYDLDWTVLQDGDQLDLSITYSNLLFTQEQIINFIGSYEKILLAFVEDAAASFRSVDILTRWDRSVYGELNETAADFPADKTIPQMFVDAAEKFPTHIALSSGERAMTYQELDERTNQVAQTLLRKGLKKGDFAAIVMERSMETVISLLGIIKAGGVYVPIDPSYPEEWIRYVLSDNNAPYILSTSAHVNQINDLLEYCPAVKEVLYVDGELHDAPTTPPEVDLVPTDLAYVIYTSGSTGRPKGTLIAHRGVVNLGVWARDHYGCGKDDCILEFASYSFDASVLETWSALFWGGRLHLLGKEGRMSIEAFADTVDQVKATAVMILPTVFFKQLAAYLSDEDYPKLKSLKRLIPGGESFPGEVARLWQRRFGMDIQIVNAYGPTECTVFSTVYDIKDTIPENRANIPIGKPLNNYELHVLNEAQQPCPINVPGELYIGSVGLAVGYLNQPEKTAEVFLPNRFSDDPEARLYKSGDIVKLLANGNIEYVGRKDSQVKIRGFRIEIGEIEDHFGKLPEVGEIAIIVKQLENISTLVAYYTTKDGVPLSNDTIRDFLGEALPPFMIPAYIFHLEHMPLTPSGKMNRKELTAREVELPTVQTEYVAPETEEQQNIATVWQDVLGIDNIGIHDDFFLLGGHSLKILKALVPLKPMFPALKVQDFFAHPTVAQLAAYLAEAQALPQTLEEQRPMTWEPKALHENLYFNPIPYEGAILEQPNAVLVTGTTGYLGSHVLYELLDLTRAHAYCLVRGSDAAAAESRLLEKMKFYFGESITEKMAGRVTVVQGDLGEPGLGLEPAVVEELNEHVEAVIHCGADVRYFGDETHFYNVNVRGTNELLNFARRREGVRFHHVSTLSIPEELALSGLLNPLTGEMSEEVEIDHVYAHSKLLAEQVVHDAMQEGLPVTIYRAGNLTCESKTGGFQQNIDTNAFYRTLKGMLLLGSTPDIRCFIDLTPIDYASQALVHLIGRPDSVNEMIHLCNPQQISHATLVQILQSFGYRITVMKQHKYKEWLFQENMTNEQEETLQLIIAQLEGEGLRNSDLYYGCKRTQELLQGTGIQCPKPDSLLLFNLVKYAVSIGYFPTSQHWNYLEEDQFTETSKYKHFTITAGRTQVE